MKVFYFSISLFIALLCVQTTRAQCENYSIQIFSDVAEGGPTSLTWVLTDVNGVTLYSGAASFNAFTFFNSTTVCLEDGQYTIVFTGNVPLMAGAFLAGVQQGSTNIFPTNQVVFGNLTFVYEFNTEPFILDCNASFIWEETDTPGLVQFQSTSTGSGNEITHAWEFAGDTQPGPENPTYQYGANGTYNVCLSIVAAQNGQVGCIDTHCANVTVAGFSSGENCPGDISITPLSELGCGYFHFEVQNAEQGAGLAWFPEGPQGDVFTGLELDHYYFSPGVYEVCAAYISAQCPSGTQICQTFPNYCNDCPEEIAILSSDCAEATLQFGANNSPSTLVTYNWDDGTTSSGGVTQFHEYSAQNDTYNVCAVFTSNYCTETASDCVTLDYSDCFTNSCPDSIVVSNNGCFLYTLSVFGAEPGASYLWNINGVNYTTPTVNYSIVFPFTANVSVTYSSASCPQGVSLNTTLTYAMCGAVCPVDITAQQIDCNVYELSFVNVAPNMQAVWTINGEQFSGNEIIYALTDNVPYYVSAVVTNPNCPSPINLSKTLIWDDCATECPQNIVATNLGCNVFELTTDILEEGSTSYWSIAGSQFIGSTIYYTLPNQNNAQVALNYVGEHCSFGVDLNTTLVYEQCSIGCPEEILVVELGCNTFQLSLNVSEPESISWNINGEIFTGNNIGFVLNNPGTYTVTVFYNGSDCSDGVSLETTLEYQECGVVCPSVIISENLCNDYYFTIDAEYPQLGAVWTVNGVTLGTEIDFAYSLPAPGDYTVSVYYTGPDCPLGTTLTSTFAYVECNNACPTAIVVDSIGCNNYVLSLNNIAPNELAIWNINGLTLPPISSIAINVVEAGTTVSVYYQGTECTSGVLLDTTFLWSACDNGSCLASFTHSPGKNGEVTFTNNSVYDGMAEFVWNFADGQVSSDQSPVHQYTENGIYNVCLTIISENCEDTFCTEVSVDNLFVCNENEIEVVLNVTNTSATSELLHYSLLNALSETVASVEWMVEPGQNSSAQMFCLSEGCFSFSLNDPVNVTSISLIINSITSAANLLNITLPDTQPDTTIYFGVDADCPDWVTESAETLISVYPNPASYMLNVISGSLIQEYCITDALGRTRKREKIRSTGLQVDVSDMVSGIYFISLTTDRATMVRSFEILR